LGGLSSKTKAQKGAATVTDEHERASPGFGGQASRTDIPGCVLDWPGDPYELAALGGWPDKKKIE